MKLLMHIELSKDLIDKILALFPIRKFKTNAPLFYEGQVPISGYLVVNGSVQISRKKKFKKVLHNGSLIGIDELIHKRPSEISAEALPNTEVCFLDKSTLMENSELLTTFNEIFETKK